MSTVRGRWLSAPRWSAMWSCRRSGDNRSWLWRSWSWSWSLLLLLLSAMAAMLAFSSYDVLLTRDGGHVMPETDVGAGRTVSNRLLDQLRSHMDKAVLTGKVWERQATNWSGIPDLNSTPRCSQRRRVLLIQDTCRKYGLTGTELTRKDYWRLLVNRKRRLVYCSIPKAGCTTMRTLLRNPDRRKRGRGVSALDKASVVRRDTYAKLLLVRHPLSRLYSAYYDKIRNGRLTHPGFYRDVAERYFPGSTPDGRLNLTFAQFATLVAYEYSSGSFVNRHWMTQYELCRPCQIPYSYVAKLETMALDGPAIQTMTGRRLIRLNAQANVSGPSELLRQYRLLPAEVLRRLMRVYEVDFRLFGYGWLDDVGPVCTDADVLDTLNADSVNCCRSL